jgi:hypothetical protein
MFLLRGNNAKNFPAKKMPTNHMVYACDGKIRTEYYIFMIDR